MSRKKDKKCEASTMAGGDVKGFQAGYQGGKKKKNNVNKPYVERELFENSVIKAILEDRPFAEVMKEDDPQHPIPVEAGSLLQWLKKISMSLSLSQKKDFLRDILSALKIDGGKIGLSPQLVAAVKNPLSNEVVRKIGNRWVIFDDEKDVELGSYPKRSLAWDKQRQIRRSQISQRKSKEAERKRQQQAGKPSIERKPGIKRATTKKGFKTKQEALELVKQTIKENVYRYIFEQPQEDEKTAVWNKFLGNVQDLKDPGLNKIMSNLISSESKLLQKAFSAIQKTLSGNFEVKDGKKEKIEGEARHTFQVILDGKPLVFAVRLQNGKPVIYTPDETRNALNEMGSQNSKALIGELIHIQETVLDNMDEVVKMARKRDEYLNKVEKKLDDSLLKLSPLEINMLKFLIKTKYKAIK